MGFPIAARFAHPDAGYKGDQDQAAEHLTPGAVYVVERLEVGRSDSRLFLGIPGGPVFGFNTVMFEAAETPNDWDDDDEADGKPEGDATMSTAGDLADELPAALEEEPPTGSVVAIGWGESRQEVWVSNKSNVGNWYCPDIPMRGDWHPNWHDVKHRAEGRTMTLLTPASRDAYAAGFDAGVARVGEAVTQAIDEARLYANGNYPDAA
jgi:hypothetical protein